MEDVIGIRVRDKNNGQFGFMTWGRLWGATNDKDLLDAVTPFVKHCQGVDEPIEIEICFSLRDVQQTPYFYEGIIHFSWGQPRREEKYKTWRKEMRKEVKRGRQIYFLGAVDK